MAMASHVVQHLWQGGVQPLAGRPIQRRPAAGQQLDDDVVIDPNRLTWPTRRWRAAGCPLRHRSADRLAGVIPMPARHLAHRVQDR
jgi:hypothetical protein